MRFEWPLKYLDQIADEVTVGYVGPMASEYVESGVPFLRSLNIEPSGVNKNDLKFITPEFHLRIKKSALRPGDVAIVRTGKPGTCAVIPDWLVDANCSDLVLVKCGKELRPRFLCYWVNSVASHHISSHTVGAVQQHFNVGAAKTMKVAVPSLEEQDRVIAVLGGLDDRITLLRETNATLEAIAQALFKSWFVDFDPVRAKLEGRTPECMDEATAWLFTDSFEESELGLVPRGWRVVEIGSVADILNGFAFKSADYVDSEDGVFVLRTTNFSNDGYATRLEKDVFLPRSFMSSHEKFLCQAFDFQLVMVGASVGHTSLLLPNMLPALRNQNMWCFRPKVSFPSKFFIHESVKLNLNQALRGTSGSAREFLRKSDFLLNKVLLPSESLLAVFENHLTVLKDSIANNTHQSSTLVTLRDTLLPRLISGQLRLPETL